MQLARVPTTVSVAQYLAEEDGGECRHEYLAGQVVAMTGASRAHGLLAGNLFARLHPEARRKGCQLFTADMRVRIDHDGDSYFYYPDVVASCDPRDRDPLFTRSPCFIAEVLSPATERIDTREKLLAYRLLPSLRDYLLLRQDRMEATLYQRGDDGIWTQQRALLPQDVLHLRCLDAQVRLAEVYADLPELPA